jgi:hypothetical protein
VHLASAELTMRANRPALFSGIHSVTATNALHYAFRTTTDEPLRYLLLLQAAGWMAQFRTFAGAKSENLRAVQLTGLEKAEGDPMAEWKANPDVNASRVLRVAGDRETRQDFLAGALRQAVAKADEPHYYKYMAALLEDVPTIGTAWQPRMLASMIYYMKGPADAEPVAMKRAREALRALS